MDLQRVFRIASEQLGDAARNEVEVLQEEEYAEVQKQCRCEYAALFLLSGILEGFLLFL